MTSSAWLRMLVVLLVLTVSVMVVVGSALQTSKTQAGKLLQIEGQVSVNGAAAISGATVNSDSTITTAARSSAVVSLGKLGRVEVLPDSSMKLIFGDANVSVSMLDAGRVRLSSSSNVTTKATTKDGEVITYRQSAK